MMIRTRVSSYANDLGWTQIPSGPTYFQFTSAQFPGMDAFAGVNVVAAAGSVWVSLVKSAVPYACQVVRLDQNSLTVEAVIPIGPPGSCLNALAFAPDDGSGKIWGTDFCHSAAYRIDVATNSVDLTVTTDLVAPCRGVVHGNGKIAVVSCGSNTVVFFDAATGAWLGSTMVGTAPYQISFDGANFWVSNSGSGNVMVLDGATMAVIGTITTGGTPFYPFPDGTRVHAISTNSTVTVIAQAPPFEVCQNWVMPAGAGGHFALKIRDQLWVIMHGRNSIGIFNNNGTLDKEIGLGVNPSGICFTGYDVFTIDYAGWALRRHNVEHKS